jgi:hypothetical protein
MVLLCFDSGFIDGFESLEFHCEFMDYHVDFAILASPNLFPYSVKSKVCFKRLVVLLIFAFHDETDHIALVLASGRVVVSIDVFIVVRITFIVHQCVFVRHDFGLLSFH